MKPWQAFILFTAMGIFLTFAVQHLYFSDALLQQTFGSQLAYERINSMFALSRKWQWVGYAIIPLFILLRVFYTTVFLYIGLFFADISPGFGKIFKIALWADFAFVLSGVAKLVILIFFKEVSTLHDLQFQPLSVMELMDQASVDPIFIYPLSLLNLFELSYFIALAWMLKELLKEKQPEMYFGMGKSLQLVGVSYGSGLLLWVIIVMFITLNLS